MLQRNTCPLLALLVLCSCGQAPHAVAEEGPVVDPSVIGGRLQTCVKPHAVAVYDSLSTILRFTLVAFSDDPDVCTRLRRGAGLHQSSTLFALLNGGAQGAYTARKQIGEVLSGSGGEGAALFTSQLLDETCSLVKPQGSKDVQAISEAGALRITHTGDHLEGTLDLTLSADQSAVQTPFKAVRCEGLLASVLQRMPLSSVSAGRAAPLKCE